MCVTNVQIVQYIYIDNLPYYIWLLQSNWRTKNGLSYGQVALLCMEYWVPFQNSIQFTRTVASLPAYLALFSNLGLKSIARAAFLESVGVAEDETEVDVAELLVLLLITLEIANAEAVWLVVPTPP